MQSEAGSAAGPVQCDPAQEAARAAPWCGLASWLGLAVGLGVGLAVRALGGADNSAVALGVLAAAMTGFGAMLGSRVRRERWGWLGMVGTAVSAAPLALFLLAMMSKSLR